MNELTPRNIFTSILNRNQPAATARIQGNENNPNLFGLVSFYNTPFGGLLVNAEVYGLPDRNRPMMPMMNNTTIAPSNPMLRNASTPSMSSSENVVKKAAVMPPHNISDFYGMHIHDVGDCSEGSINTQSGINPQPFPNTGSHYNPSNALHPEHAGDFPPLLSNNGYAWTAFYTGRIRLEEIIGRSVIIHGMRDDFTSQPSGDSGEKIGCGVIQAV